MDVTAGLKRKLSTEELMLLNCGAGEDSLLRVPWTARGSNQLILKEISPEYSLQGLKMKLKFQYFGYLMWKTDTLEKILMLGKTEGRRRRGWQEDKMVGCITNSMDMFEYTLGFVMDREAWCTEVHGAAKSRTSKLLNWLWNGLIRSKVMHILNFDKCCKFTKIL